MKIFSKNKNYEKYYKDLIPYIKREESQKYFYIILSITASIFFLLFAINPTLSTIANLKKQILDARSVNDKLTTKVQNLSSLSQEYQIIQPDIPFILDAIPENPEAPTVVGQIKKLGEENSIIVTNIEVFPVNLSTKNTSRSADFTFSIIGNSDFINAQKFLNDLTNMQRVLSITSIQLSENPKIENQIDFIFKGSAYYKK
jgi:Tfp pilus assembly protein PilO